MFNADVLNALELLRKEIRTAQKETQRETQSKIKDLVREIVKEIAAKENAELVVREKNYREKYFELAAIVKEQSITLFKLRESIEKLHEEK